MKTNENPHTCFSTRRKKKVKNATKHWVCSKVKDWLIADGSLRAREMQKKIKEHYKVNVHYKRVWMGKELSIQANLW